ncbi:MAG: hypothetical protein FJ395_13210 [Verrucomicrobia bacterium]|nr:hypothetical protein [Verrucomicrobiota bacterium]
MAVIIHPRRFKLYRKPSAAQIALLEKDLHSTGLLDNDFVLLVGGIALALHAGEYYRLHADIDLAVFETDIPRFHALAKRNGFTIAERIATGHVSSQYDVSIVRKVSAQKTGTSKHIRAIRNLRPFMFSRRDSFLDVFVYVPNSGFVDAPHYDFRFPKERFFPITRKTLSSGLVLNIPNPLHILDMKRADRRTVNANDLRFYGDLEHSMRTGTSSPKAV